MIINKLLEKLYSRLCIETYTGKPFKIKVKKFLIPILEYFLFPEFRKKTYPIKKVFLTSVVVITVFFISRSFYRNFKYDDMLQDRNKELASAYKEIAYLKDSAKFVVHDEIFNEFNNSRDYIRCKIFERSGILVPQSVPYSHLMLIAKNAREKNIPVSIIARIIYHESKFTPHAVNESSGAFGYMQMMPVTFENFEKKLNLKGGRTPENNLIAGTELLNVGFERWYKKTNDPQKAWEMTLACYAMGDSLPRIMGRVPNCVKPFVTYVLKDFDFDNYFEKLKTDI